MRLRACDHYMSLKVCWYGLWALSFELSQLNGHGSRLVCEVALNIQDEARLLWFNIKRSPVSGLGFNPSPKVALAAVHACQQYTIWVRNIFSILGSGFWGRHSTPPTNFPGCYIRAGAAFPGNFWTWPKTSARLVQLWKNIALIFLKAAWLQFSYWVHFTFKIQNPIYMFTFIK